VLPTSTNSENMTQRKTRTQHAFTQNARVHRNCRNKTEKGKNKNAKDNTQNRNVHRATSYLSLTRSLAHSNSELRAYGAWYPPDGGASE
jgi:hypothetical protein